MNLGIVITDKGCLEKENQLLSIRRFFSRQTKKMFEVYIQDLAIYGNYYITDRLNKIDQ